LCIILSLFFFYYFVCVQVYLPELRQLFGAVTVLPALQVITCLWLSSRLSLVCTLGQKLYWDLQCKRDWTWIRLTQIVDFVVHFRLNVLNTSFPG
jgi:hypothetical protein